MRTVPDDIARKLLAGTDRLTVGFEDVRMDDIARASGIPRATLYYHFPSKQDVLSFLFDALIADYRRTVVADDHGPARERLTRLLDRVLEQVRNHPGISQIVVANLGQLAKLSELATGAYDPLQQQIELILSDGILAGEVRSLDVAQTAVFVSTITNVIVTRSLVTGELEDQREISESLVGLVWEGVGIDAPEPA